MASDKVWKPLRPGLHLIAEDNDAELYVSLDGSGLELRAADDEPHKTMAVQLDPNKYRLCQLVDAPAAVMPDEVRETIRRLAAFGIPVGCTNADWNRWRDTVTRWLDAQGKEVTSE